MLHFDQCRTEPEIYFKGRHRQSGWEDSSKSLRSWTAFLAQQANSFDRLAAVHPFRKGPRFLDSQESIKTQGSRVASRSLAVESDLRCLQREMVEIPLSMIMNRLSTVVEVRKEFSIPGRTLFRDDPHVMGDKSEEVMLSRHIQRMRGHPGGVDFRVPCTDQVCFTLILNRMAPISALRSLSKTGHLINCGSQTYDWVCGGRRWQAK